MKYLIKGQEMYPIPIGDDPNVNAEELLALFEETVTDYLHNELRIISLARQKQLAFMQRYSLSNLEEYLWKGLNETADANNLWGIIQTLSNRMRKLLRDCAKEKNLHPLEDLINCEWWTLKIYLLDDEEEEFPPRGDVLRGRHRYGGNANYAFGMKIHYPGKDIVLRYAASDEVIKKEGRWSFNNIRFADLGVLLAKVFLAKSAFIWLKAEGESGAAEYTYAPGICIRRDTKEYDFEHYQDLLALIQHRYGEIEALSNPEIDFRKKNKLPFALMTVWEVERIFYKNPGDYLRDGYNPFFMLFDTACDGRIGNSFFSKLKTEVLYITSKRASEVKKAETLREYESTSRAKSYQTKKNIPQKILKMMETSEFNQYFDYVEFDEECDVKRLSLVGKEVLAFFKEMPKIQSFTKGNSIRFRKLGNHKAIGLYYPLIQCLCVDLRNTTSFIHELGHLIDHCMDDGGQLSEQPAFFNVLMLYRGFLEGNKKDIGKGKYDLGYYKEATEVFARSFELYIVKVKKYKNNLIPDSFSKTHYPEEREDIMNEITRYFDSLDLIGECITVESAEEPASETKCTLARIEDAIHNRKIIYIADCEAEKPEGYPIEDARKVKFENCRFVFDEGLKLVCDYDGHEGSILGLFNSAEEIVDYIEKHPIRITRIESTVPLKAASVANAAPKKDIKDLRGQQLLDAISAPALSYDREKMCWRYEGDVHEWFLLLSAAFNSFGTGSYTIPEEWRKNKKFWQRFSYIEIVNLSKDAGTWDLRKKAAADTCENLLSDPKFKNHAEEMGGFTDEKRGCDFFYQLTGEFRNEHSTIRQSMATFLMRYLYETDKVFIKTADKVIPDRVEAKFRFPMV